MCGLEFSDLGVIAFYVWVLWMVAGLVVICTAIAVAPDRQSKQIVDEVWDKRDPVIGRVSILLVLIAMWPGLLWALVMDIKEGNFNGR